MEIIDRGLFITYFIYGAVVLLLLAAGLSILARWRASRNEAPERAGAREKQDTATLERLVAERTEALTRSLAGLQRERALADSLLDSVPAIVLLLTPDGAIERANPYFEKLSGYRLDEIRGKDWFATFIPERERPRVLHLFDQALSGNPTRSNVNAILLRNGEERLIEWSDSVIRDAEGRTLSLLAVGHDVTGLKQADAQLRESEAKYRGLIEGLDEMLFRMNLPDGRYEYISPSAERVVGIPAETILADPMHVARVIHPNSRTFFETVWAELLNGHVRPLYEYQIIDSRGQERWIVQSNSAIRDPSGKLIALEGVCRDATDQKRVELRLRESEELYRSLYESMRDAFVLVRMDGRIVDCNPAYEQMLGYSKAELQRLTYMDVTPPHWHAMERQIVEEQLLTRGYSDIYEKEYRRKDGSVFPIEIRSFLRRGTDGGAVGSWAIVRDISERRKAEQALKASEARLRAILESEPECVKSVDPEGRLLEMNAAGLRMIEADSLRQVKDTNLLDIVAPESRAAFRSGLDANLRGETTLMEFEIVGLKGTRRWMEQHAVPLRDQADQGKVSGMLAVTRDVTERKHAEERLRLSEEKYRGLYDSMIDAFVVDGPGGYIVECNRTYQEMLGYSADELRGLTYKDLTPARWHQMEAEIVRDQLDVRGYTDIYEKEYRRKDGTIIPVEIRAFLRRGPDGKPAGSWAIVRDISARKAIERELRQSRELLRDAVAVAGVGVFDHDHVAETIYWSPEQRAIYGWSADEPVTLQKFLDHLHPEDKPWIFDAVKRAHDPSGDGRYETDHRILRRDGTVRWLTSKSQTFFDTINGKRQPVRTVGVAYDVTAIRSADQALRESEHRLRQAQSMAKVGNWTLELAGGHLWWSDEIFHIFELDRERFGASYQAFLDAIHPDDRDAVNKAYSDSIANRTPYQITHRLRMPDGRIKWVEERCQTTYDDGGTAILSSGTIQDITERIAAEEAVRERESWLRAILENSPTEIVLKDRDLRFMAVSKNVADDHGSTMAGLVGRSSRELFPSEIAAVYEAADRRVLETGEAVHQDVSEIDNGVVRYIHSVKFPLRDDKGRVIGIGSLSTDTTEFKRIERGMKALSTELIALDGAPFYELAAARLAELLNVEYAFITRIEAQRAGEARTIALIEDGALRPNTAYKLPGTPSEGILKGLPCIIEQDAQARYPADRDLAERGVAAYAGEPLVDQAGRILGHVVVMSRRRFRDVAVVGALLKMFAVAISTTIVRERNRQQYIDLFEFAPGGLIMVDEEGRISLVNHQAEEMFGWSRAELIGEPVEILVPPDRRGGHQSLRELYQAAGQRRQMAPGRGVLRGLRKDGTEFPAEIDLAPVQSESGTMIAASVRDVTSRQLLEAQLAQATKMEAIGKLTGGMAHDFNNYLGVIIGNLDLLKERNLPDAKARKLIEAALAGALHGAEVTQSLLAFARRQPLEVEHVEINSRVKGIAKLLARTLGKDIRIATRLAPDLWPVKIDGAQLDSCIVNLAGNARDAMPNGGTVTIGTENVHLDEHYVRLNPGVAVGDYVLIEVSDTGSGMTEDVQARAFEPFFTTKGPGHGSGLGLSMVYGFVKQSGGHIKIYSEVGHGTSMRIYLPRGSTGTDAKHDAPPIETVPKGKGQLVLVVEDNADLREASVAQLALLGYEVLEAESGAAALDVIERSTRHVDLLFTDVVMPGAMNGYELATEVMARRPTTRVLLASGFPGETVERNAQDARKWQLLRKPYRMDELGRAVHAALRRIESVVVG